MPKIGWIWKQQGNAAKKQNTEEKLVSASAE